MSKRSKYQGKRDRWYDPQMIESKACAQLSGKSLRVLFLLMNRTRKELCTIGKHEGWAVANNFEIVLPYQVAASKYGIGEDAFRDAINELERYGFLDIDRGCPEARRPNKFAISDRWRAWDTEAFVRKDTRSESAKAKDNTTRAAAKSRLSLLKGRCVTATTGAVAAVRSRAVLR